MLVYGKGQFFLPHQDSEKDDAMVGTLVVSLPSVHTGGELVIDHAGERKTFRASKEELTFVVFYCDCRHQVMPVRSGYRVTLTFNLLADARVPAAEVGPIAEVTHCLTEHFSGPATPSYGGRDLAPPNRLVVLLDHEYTQRGLNWRCLKGADVGRAALLRAAAEQAGCDAVLALAEVKETWDALPVGDDPWDGSWDGSWDGDYDETEPGEGADDFELNELIDDEITLTWWTAPDGAGGEPISLYVPDHEACAATSSAHLEPYQSEYEGYMGNYGNTLDRWYRRAAIVLWPRERAFAARAEASSLWALQQLRDRIEAGDLEGANAAAESLAPFWTRTAAQAGLLGLCLQVAAGLSVAETASMLLEPFHIEMITHEQVAGLVAVARRYGDEWTRNVVDGWFGTHRYYGADRGEWVNKKLAELCATLRTAGSPGVARLLGAGAWRWMDRELRRWTTTAGSKIRQPQLEMLSTPFARLVEAADDKLRDEIIGALREYDDSVLECTFPALRLAGASPAVGLDAVARDCAGRLGKIVARPLREDDDWSIEWTGCGCELCATLATFLGSRTRQTLEWPLVTAGRRHVHSQIDAAELPVRHQTRRQGRPYTLVLVKTDELFSRAVEARHKAVMDLAWLASTWDNATLRT